MVAIDTDRPSEAIAKSRPQMAMNMTSQAFVKQMGMFLITTLMTDLYLHFICAFIINHHLAQYTYIIFRWWTVSGALPDNAGRFSYLLNICGPVGRLKDAGAIDEMTGKSLGKAGSALKTYGMHVVGMCFKREIRVL